jgi:hypothetical protein
VTSVASLLVVHARLESQKVVRPGGSQRGSQYPEHLADRFARCGPSAVQAYPWS